MFKNNDRKFKGKSTLTKQGFSLPKEINGLYLFVCCPDLFTST